MKLWKPIEVNWAMKLDLLISLDNQEQKKKIGKKKISGFSFTQLCGLIRPKAFIGQQMDTINFWRQLVAGAVIFNKLIDLRQLCWNLRKDRQTGKPQE